MAPQDEQRAGARFGKYQIVRKLGSGSHGVVYEAAVSGPMGFSKRVAVKVLRSQVVESDQGFVREMVNEARVGGMLHHPNVVNVLEFGQVRDRYFITAEYVDGVTLADIIAHRRAEDRALPASVVLGLIEQVCRGLHYAHTLKDPDGRPLNVIHRDVKPSNILVDRHGVARIMDFGIAKAASNLFQTTAAEVIRGTPQYIAPEQILGEKPLRPGCDIFALGAVLYELVTLQPLFSHSGLEELFAAILEGDLNQSFTVAEARLQGITPILQRALAREQAARYQYARSMGHDVRRLAGRHPTVPEVEDFVSALLPRIEQGRAAPIDDLASLEQDLVQESNRWATPGEQGDESNAATILTRVPGPPASSEQRRFGRMALIAVAAVGCLAIAVSGLVGVAGVIVGYTMLARSDPDGVVAPVVVVGDYSDHGPAVPILEPPPPVEFVERVVEGAVADAVVESGDEPTSPEPPPLAPLLPIQTAGDPAVTSTSATAYISINARPWASVYLDGELLGTTPLKDREIPPGSHSLRLECGPCEGAQRRSYAFTVAPSHTYTGPFTEFSR